MNIFSCIRSSCRAISDQSRHVKIQKCKLNDYVKSLPLDEVETLEMDTENHFCGDIEQTLNYFFVLDSINFGSGYFRYLDKIPDKTGYFTVAYLLKEEFLKKGGMNCRYLQNISTEDCYRIFRQRPENSEIFPLMNLFAKALNQLGDFIEHDFSGSFKELLLRCENSAARLVETLIRMPFYKDISIYEGQKVYFLKRAQITASDLNIALKNSGPGQFDDIAELTIFADNLVPHVLWIDGVLKYSDSLSEKIRKNQFIASGSNEEIELRANAVHAVELLKAEAAHTGKPITSQQLDYLLWNRGQAEKYHDPAPHSTFSFYY
ncbi:MAG: hypothetical protein Kow0029_24690 [Candidatus Rifleibacteriota bacterium]